jgi:hypothetical protein
MRNWANSGRDEDRRRDNFRISRSQVIDSTQGMYGDLQAVTGCSLSAIAVIELPGATE